jgi:hypothetical protein
VQLPELVARLLVVELVAALDDDAVLVVVELFALLPDDEPPPQPISPVAPIRLNIPNVPNVRRRSLSIVVLLVAEAALVEDEFLLDGLSIRFSQRGCGLACDTSTENECAQDCERIQEEI